MDFYYSYSKKKKQLFELSIKMEFLHKNFLIGLNLANFI